MNSINRSNAPYSYHTFIFPFLWDNSGRVTRTEFKKCMREGWKEDKLEDYKAKSNILLYNQYHYFNRAMRNVIHTPCFDNDAITWNYCFDMGALGQNGGEWLSSVKDSNNPAEFVIKKGAFKAALALNGIRLKLFNTGVGMLLFELENYEKNDETYITKINEFGRHVFIPYTYINDKGNRDCNLFADSISLSFNGKIIKEASSNIAECFPTKETDTILIKPITFLLSSNLGCSVTATETNDSTKLYIEPIIDDRMFVACLVDNESFVHDMALRVNDDYKYLADAQHSSVFDENSAARRMYMMMFVDGDGMTCYNKDMLYDLLRKHIYGRWIECGTVSGITEYSFVCVTGSTEYTSTPFLTQYIEMIIFVLAQRASLLAFERIISEIACQKSHMNVDKVQSNFVIFQSEMLLQEVTGQQQGIEYYDMLLENMFINKQQNEIEEQIKSLVELKTSHHEKTENFILLILALLSVFDAVQIIIGTWLSFNNFICLGVSVICFITIFIWKLFRSKRWIR